MISQLEIILLVHLLRNFIQLLLFYELITIVQDYHNIDAVRFAYLVETSSKWGRLQHTANNRLQLACFAISNKPVVTDQSLQK